MYLSKHEFVLLYDNDSGISVAPEGYETIPSKFILDGVVDWGLFIKITQPAGLTAAPVVEFINLHGEMEEGAVFQTSVIDPIDGGEDEWVFIPGATCAPISMRVVVSNPDTAATIVVNGAYVVYMCVSEIVPGSRTNGFLMGVN